MKPRCAVQFAASKELMEGSVSLQGRVVVGGRLAWGRGLAHNRLKKFDRAKSDLKRACVPLHLPSNLCRVWCRNTR